MLKKIAPKAILAVIALLALVQLVPYGRGHANPRVSREVAWNSPATRELAVRACYDCHSNETRWPWYSNVAPVSWLVQHDVDEGRQVLNFSEWDRSQPEAGEAAEQVQEGKMPLWYYVLLHSEARLNETEKDTLMQGLIATLGGDAGEGNEDN
jgi:hypothetical protein